MKRRITRCLALAMLLALVVGAMPAMAASNKVKINAETLWVGAYGLQISAENVPEKAKVTSAKSSNTSVMTVSKGVKTFSDITVSPGKKSGKAKLTVKYKVGKKSYTATATYTVKKYPSAIKSLKVNGTTVNFKKNKSSYHLQKYKKTKATITIKAGSGWNVESMSFNSPSAYTDVKSGKSFKVPKGESGGVIICMRHKKTGDYFLYYVGFER